MVNFFIFLWLSDTDLFRSLFQATERFLIFLQKVCRYSLGCFKITATLWDHLFKENILMNQLWMNQCLIEEWTSFRVFSLTLNICCYLPCSSTINLNPLCWYLLLKDWNRINISFPLEVIDAGFFEPQSWSIFGEVVSLPLCITRCVSALVWK